jgi:hypothetical protein
LGLPVSSTCISELASTAPMLLKTAAALPSGHLRTYMPVHEPHTG